MSSEPTAIATAGVEAWRRGDFESVEEILDPAVQWHWFEPGEWDCHGRGDVMRTLRERYDQAFAKGDLTSNRLRGPTDVPATPDRVALDPCAPSPTFTQTL